MEQKPTVTLVIVATLAINGAVALATAILALCVCLLAAIRLASIGLAAIVLLLAVLLPVLLTPIVRLLLVLGPVVGAAVGLAWLERLCARGKCGSAGPEAALSWLAAAEIHLLLRLPSEVLVLLRGGVILPRVKVGHCGGKMPAVGGRMGV